MDKSSHAQLSVGGHYFMIIIQEQEQLTTCHGIDELWDRAPSYWHLQHLLIPSTCKDFNAWYVTIHLITISSGHMQVLQLDRWSFIKSLYSLVAENAKENCYIFIIFRSRPWSTSVRKSRKNAFEVRGIIVMQLTNLIAKESWRRHQMEHFLCYWPLVRGIHRSPVTRNFNVFFDLRLNKRLSKQSWGWWFETPSLTSL